MYMYCIEAVFLFIFLLYVRAANSYVQCIKNVVVNTCGNPLSGLVYSTFKAKMLAASAPYDKGCAVGNQLSFFCCCII